MISTEDAQIYAASEYCVQVVSTIDILVVTLCVHCMKLISHKHWQLNMYFICSLFYHALLVTKTSTVLNERVISE
jgi:hypothetical protein